MIDAVYFRRKRGGQLYYDLDGQIWPNIAVYCDYKAFRLDIQIIEGDTSMRLCARGALRRRI